MRRELRATRRRLVAGISTWGAVSLLGCRQRSATVSPSVWDEAPPAAQTDAASALAPRWEDPGALPRPLGNDLLATWLTEPGSHATHLRLLLPTSGPITMTAEVVAIVLETLRDELTQALADTDVVVRTAHGPGRIEVSLHGHRARTDVMFDALAKVVAQDASTRLEQGKRRVLEGLDMPVSIEVALATLLTELLAFPNPLHIRAAATEELPRVALTNGWSRLVDPHRAVLVGHSGHSRDDVEPALGRLATAWSTRSLRKAPATAIERLHVPLTTASGNALLGGHSLPPMRASSLSAIGGGVVAFGRRISTPTLRTRALARLAQRLVQENLDARLTIAGRDALFTVLVPLDGDDAAKTVASAVTKLETLANTRQPRQRMFQASRLWLGARVVESSLHGEDWTELWSEAIDLAEDDRSIGITLGRTAAELLDIQGEELLAWQAEWLDPVGGRGGWSWAAAGMPPPAARQLEELTDLRYVP